MSERMDADREWDLIEARANEVLMRRPVCIKCGRHIQEDYAYDFGKGIVCGDCVMDAVEDFAVEVMDD